MKKKVGRPQGEPKTFILIGFSNKDIERLGREKIREISINAVKKEG